MTRPLRFWSAGGRVRVLGARAFVFDKPLEVHGVVSSDTGLRVMGAAGVLGSTIIGLLLVLWRVW